MSEVVLLILKKKIIQMIIRSDNFGDETKMKNRSMNRINRNKEYLKHFFRFFPGSHSKLKHKLSKIMILI